MTILNLLDASASAIGYTRIVFPDGQPHIRLHTDTLPTDRAEPLLILCRLSSPAELLTLLLVKNTLDYEEYSNVSVHISYLMAARMDRVMQEGEPFSLKVVAQLLNQADFKRIKIFDPHSEVSTALIDRSYAITNHQFVKDVLNAYSSRLDKEHIILVAPDAGATKKIHKLAQFLDTEHVIECSKERDLKTGAISNFRTTADNLDGCTCVIVDDICDGGGTFAGTAALLKSIGAAKVHLVVSHGIFSKGIAIPGVDQIFTTDSFQKTEGVHCFGVTQYL